MIRPAQPGDVPQIAELFHRTVREVNAADYTPAQTQVWAGEAPEPEKWSARLSVKRTFVCEVDGRIRGFAEFEDTGHIDALYVHADFQNQGVGEPMLAPLFAEIRAQGMNSAIIWVLAANPSRFFYENMGGKRVGERDEAMWGTTLREIAYGWLDLEAALKAGRPNVK